MPTYSINLYSDGAITDSTGRAVFEVPAKTYDRKIVVIATWGSGWQSAYYYYGLLNSTLAANATNISANVSYNGNPIKNTDVYANFMLFKA